MNVKQKITNGLGYTLNNLLFMAVILSLTLKYEKLYSTPYFSNEMLMPEHGPECILLFEQILKYRKHVLLPSNTTQLHAALLIQCIGYTMSQKMYPFCF